MTSRMSISEAGAKHDKAVLGIEREIVIMKLIDHPNVMSLYDVWETAKELYVLPHPIKLMIYKIPGTRICRRWRIIRLLSLSRSFTA